MKLSVKSENLYCRIESDDAASVYALTGLIVAHLMARKEKFEVDVE